MSRRGVWVVLVVSCLTACSSETSRDQQQPEVPQLDPDAIAELEGIGVGKYAGEAVVIGEESQEDGVVRVSFDPESGPKCVFGDPFAAYYVDRHSPDLVIVLDVGGACWSSLCNAMPLVEPQVGVFAQTFLGLTEYSNRAPDAVSFDTWSAVVVPNCDGSVFMGDNDVQLEGGGMRFFRGQRHIAAALDLAVKHFPNPRRVMLVGGSAGGYGTITAAPAVRLRYPDAELFVFNDAGPGIVNHEQPADVAERRVEWNYESVLPPSCVDCFGENGQFWPLYSWMLERDRSLRVAVGSFTRDTVIASFLRLSPDAYEKLLRAAIQEMHDAHPDRVRRFLVPGTQHLVSGGYFHYMAADGHRLDAWVRSMVEPGTGEWLDIDASAFTPCVHADEISCLADLGCAWSAAERSCAWDEGA